MWKLQRWSSGQKEGPPLQHDGLQRGGRRAASSRPATPLHSQEVLESDAQRGLRGGHWTGLATGRECADALELCIRSGHMVSFTLGYLITSRKSWKQTVLPVTRGTQQSGFSGRSLVTSASTKGALGEPSGNIPLSCRRTGEWSLVLR